MIGLSTILCRSLWTCKSVAFGNSFGAETPEYSFGRVEFRFVRGQGKTCRMSLKLGGFLKPFKGVRGDDLASFWKKFEVLCVAEKWDSDDDKMARLPLLLDGAAFVVVDQMSDDDRKDPKKVKAALETAFAPSAAEAYHLFVGRRFGRCG
eukprot:scpid101670/ scgid30325/ 